MRCVVHQRQISSHDLNSMINMHADERRNIKEYEIQFQDLWCAPHEYQLMTIKRLVGRTELVQVFFFFFFWHMGTCIPALFEIHDGVEASWI